MKVHLDGTCISLSCALMKIRWRGFLLYPDGVFFYIDREQHSVELPKSAFGSVAYIGG